ncbi:MAG: hypothetical protein ABNH26_08505 [Celeribacter sp.]|jgi:hypothetical protein
MTQAPNYKGFALAIMEEWQGHVGIDACEKFDLAVRYNILREILGGFDPEKHTDTYGGAEKGDPWYEINAQAPAMSKED